MKKSHLRNIIKESIKSLLKEQESKGNQFHTWNYYQSNQGVPGCNNLPSNWNQGSIAVYVSNVPGGAYTPGAFNTPAGASAQTAVWNAWGQPNVGEVVKINYGPNNNELCILYEGASSTQTVPNGNFNTGATYLGTFPDCDSCYKGVNPQKPTCHGMLQFEVCDDPSGQLAVGQAVDIGGSNAPNGSNCLTCNGVMCDASNIGTSYDLGSIPSNPYPGVTAELTILFNPIWGTHQDFIPAPCPITGGKNVRSCYLMDCASTGNCYGDQNWNTNLGWYDITIGGNIPQPGDTAELPPGTWPHPSWSAGKKVYVVAVNPASGTPAAPGTLAPQDFDSIPCTDCPCNCDPAIQNWPLTFQSNYLGCNCGITTQAKGCIDPNALNNGDCCPDPVTGIVDPNCVPTNHAQQCCDYPIVTNCITNPKDCWFCKSPGSMCIQFSTTNVTFTSSYPGIKYPTQADCIANSPCSAKSSPLLQPGDEPLPQSGDEFGKEDPIDMPPVDMALRERMQNLANIKKK